MKTYKIILYILILFAFTSCEKVIQIDLNKVSPKLVIEGSVTDMPGPYIIKLTQSANYFDGNTFPVVTGATVVLSDNAGNSETLKDMNDGTYQTISLQGVVGRTYHLKISYNGKDYESFSTMPAKTELDSLVYKKIDKTHQGPFGGMGPGNPNEQMGDYRASVYYTDNPTQTNYYRLRFTVNNILVQNSEFDVQDDYLRQGLQMRSSSGQAVIFLHDSVGVELWSIDKPVYDYFSTLNDILSGGAVMSAAPQNPVTNITGDAAGYFAAYSLTKKTIYIQ